MYISSLALSKTHQTPGYNSPLGIQVTPQLGCVPNYAPDRLPKSVHVSLPFNPQIHSKSCCLPSLDLQKLITLHLLYLSPLI